MGGFEAVDPRYAALWERAQAVLDADDRVARVEVHGSIGSGEADLYSDLDIHVYATHDGHDSFLAEWPTWLAEITPTVFAATPIVPVVINTITDEGLTFDVLVLRDGTPPFTPPSGIAVGMLSGRRYEDYPAAVEYAVAETLRGLAGPFRTFLERGEHVRHMAGCAHILGLLTTVMLAENDAPPVTAKRLNASLNDEQRAALASLPPLRPTRVDIAAFGLAVAAETLRRARPLFAEYGLDWPDALEGVARRRIEELGLAFPA